MKSLFISFRRNEEGASIILIGVMILMLIVATGTAIDMGRSQLIKNKMSAALDAGALAAASHAQTEDMNVTALKYFRANFPVGYMGARMGTINITSTSTLDSVSFSLTGSVNTSFLRIVGIDTVNVSSFSQVARVTKNGLELAMVLDNTGSMDPAKVGVDKIGQLKTASTQMIDKLYGDKEVLQDVYISLVPFNTHVNMGTNHANWLFEPHPQPDWQGCTEEPRQGDTQSTDLPPTGDILTKFSQYIYQNDPTVEDPCPTSLSAMLSTKTQIKSALNAMTPSGDTHTDVGTVWGWRVLSPRWRGLWGSANNALPRDYDDPKSRKAMILLTDGDNTDTDAVLIQRHNDKQVELCNELKSHNVRIYTVAFNVTSSADVSTIKSILQGCASKPEYYFEAPDGPQLINAFRQIGDNLLSLRLTR